MKRILRNHSYLTADGRPAHNWNRRGAVADEASPTGSVFWRKYEFNGVFKQRSSESLRTRCAKLLKLLAARYTRNFVNNAGCSFIGKPLVKRPYAVRVQKAQPLPATVYAKHLHILLSFTGILFSQSVTLMLGL